MPPAQARRPVKAILGCALALPLLVGCAYDGGYYDGYYGPPEDYGYGYGRYGYGYGYPCGWPYDCDRWPHRRHHHRHLDRDDDDDGRHHGNKPPAVNPGGHATNIPPKIVRPRDIDRPRLPRVDRGGGSPPSRIWIPQQRDSRR